MVFPFITILAISIYLRNSFRNNTQFQKWNRWFIFIIIVASALFILAPSVKGTTVLCEGLLYVLLWVLLAVIYRNSIFRSYRFILIAVVPVVVTSTLPFVMKHTAPDFFKGWIAGLDRVDDFATLWAIGFLFITSRQRRELEKSRQKVEEAQQNSALLATMRDELEVQVQERTAELTRQKEALETTLEELKTTQAQLIQSEKMASLGELTAGIAHEIQNPLNFVNNFSDVNTELIAEMETEIARGDLEEAIAIAKDISANNQKITHHGRRADSIVKGMLQHSRSSNGQKELTDINAVADEYLRLAYHGLRAKDKTFNAELKTQFAGNLPRISVVPQDIGRVLLNLFTNAFYAMQQKQKTAGGSYRPELQVSTLLVANEVEIRVKDNGTGIPEAIRDKILQPFFTTKPSGQGTGLGLSLSYDIVVKGHGGSIDIRSSEGAGAEFIIRLPLSSL